MRSAHQIVNDASGNYHGYLGRQDKLAEGYLVIVNRAIIIQGTNDPADLVAWLKRDHPNESLLKAFMDTLTRNGG